MGFKHFPLGAIQSLNLPVCHTDAEYAAYAPSERPEFEPIEGEDSSAERTRRQGITAGQVLHDWLAAGHEVARRDELLSLGPTARGTRRTPLNEMRYALLAEAHEAYAVMFIDRYGYYYEEGPGSQVDDEDEEDINQLHGFGVMQPTSLPHPASDRCQAADCAKVCRGHFPGDDPALQWLGRCWHCAHKSPAARADFAAARAAAATASSFIGCDGLAGSSSDVGGVLSHRPPLIRCRPPPVQELRRTWSYHYVDANGRKYDSGEWETDMALTRVRTGWWQVLRAYVVARTIVLHWQEATQIALCAPGGAGRAGDKRKFESEF